MSADKLGELQSRQNFNIIARDLGTLNVELRPQVPLNFHPTSMAMRTSTPISHKMSGSQPFSSVVPKYDQTYHSNLARETRGLFIGPMPYDLFLQTFLPPPPEGMEDQPADDIFAQVVTNKKKESEMYDAFVCIGNSTCMGAVFTCHP